MEAKIIRKITTCLIAALVVCAVLISWTPKHIHGFTQSAVPLGVGNAMPMGHEWITRISALELLKGDPLEWEGSDPRGKWKTKQGRAKNLSLADSEVAKIKAKRIDENRYKSTYKAVYDAIIGERWVDIAGFSVAKSMISKYDGFSVISQESADIQCDHFMRRFDDAGPQGAVDAAKRCQSRFIEHFVNAAMAPSMEIQVWDGGVTSSLTEVNLNYFLLGRAAHLFQDSFSSEHVVRRPEDNYERVRQVMSYLFAAGSEQHTHSTADIFSYKSGDVIWKKGTRLDLGWSGYRIANMKPVAIVAVEANKDLWAAFIRTMDQPRERRKSVALSEAEQLVESWLSFDETEMMTWYENEGNRIKNYVKMPGEPGIGQEQTEAMKTFSEFSQMVYARRIERDRRICLYNVVAQHGHSDLMDPYLHIPYNWKWKGLKWMAPPEDWKVPASQANTGKLVRIKSAESGHYLSAKGGIASGKAIVSSPQATPLEFVQVGSNDSCVFRLRNNPSLFLNYVEITGAAKLYNSPARADFKIEETDKGSTLKNTFYKQYLWLKGDRPYISRAGKSDKENAQWIIEEIKN